MNAFHEALRLIEAEQVAIWTPYQIEIILHHHCSVAPFPRWTAPLYAPTVVELAKQGLLMADDDDVIRTTEKGARFVLALLMTPVPT